MMADNHFADVGKKGTMSLTLVLIVLDRLNTSAGLVARRYGEGTAEKNVPTI